MDLQRWLETAQADADRRGLPDLKPLLQALGEATARLRAAAWAARPSSEGKPPDE